MLFNTRLEDLLCVGSVNELTSFNPIRPGLFSFSLGPGGAQKSGCQESRCHQPTEMQLCMSHYNHKSMPDAKIEFGSFSNFGDMTSEKFLSEEGNESSNSAVYPGKWV